MWLVEGRRMEMQINWIFSGTGWWPGLRDLCYNFFLSHNRRAAQRIMQLGTEVWTSSISQDSSRSMFLDPVLRDFETGHIFVPPQLRAHLYQVLSVLGCLVQVCLELGGNKNVDWLGVPKDWVKKHCSRFSVFFHTVGLAGISKLSFVCEYSCPPMAFHRSRMPAWCRMSHDLGPWLPIRRWINRL